MNTQANSIQTADDAGYQVSEEEKAIYEQLDAIFGTPKQLSEEEQTQAVTLHGQLDALYNSIDDREPTSEEQQQIDALNSQIDALYGVRSYNALSDEEKATVDALFEKLEQIEDPDGAETDALYTELEGIFGTPKQLNEEEQTQADALEAQLEALYDSLDDKEPTAEQQQQMDSLLGQLDNLYGVKTMDQLTDAEKARVEEIFKQLEAGEDDYDDNDGADAETQALYAELDSIFGTPKELTAEEQQQADALEAQLEALYDSLGDAEPTEEQETQLNALSNQLDALHGVKTMDQLTDAEKARVEEIFSKLEDADNSDFDDNPETQALFDRLDAIYGTPKELNEAEQQQADALEAKIETLYNNIGDSEPNEAQQAELDSLYSQMDGLYGLKTDDQLTDAEKKEVEEIIAKLEQSSEDDMEDDWDEDSGDWGEGDGGSLSDADDMDGENGDSDSWNDSDSLDFSGLNDEGSEGEGHYFASWGNDDMGWDEWGSAFASNLGNFDGEDEGESGGWDNDFAGDDSDVNLSGQNGGYESMSFDWF